MLTGERMLIFVPLTKVIITPPLVLRVAAWALLLPPPLSGVVLVASPGRIVSSVYAPVTLFTAAAAAAALSPGATYEQQSKLEVSQSVSRPVGLANRQAGGPECAWQGTFCTAVPVPAPVPAAVTVVETASGIAAAVARASILVFALALASVLLLSLLLLLAPLSHSPVGRWLTCARGQSVTPSARAQAIHSGRCLVRRGGAHGGQPLIRWYCCRGCRRSGFYACSFPARVQSACTPERMITIGIKHTVNQLRS